MRLSNQERQAIKQTVATLDPDAKIYLFGSRADDTKHGGDIDLLILSDIITERDRRVIRLKLSIIYLKFAPSKIYAMILPMNI